MAIKVANNQSLTAITALPAAITGGAMTLLETQTASDNATISFTSNIDSTYKEYVFKFYDIHPETDDKAFTFQVDTGTNTSYNQTMTTTRFKAGHKEDGTYTTLGYSSGDDQAQGTAFQALTQNIGNANDESCAGELYLYDPSNSTFVKHFLARFQSTQHAEQCYDDFTAGYINTATAITRVQFKFASGNSNGVIKLYGIS